MGTALYELLEREYGVKTTLRENPVVTAVATTVTQILFNNPQRLSVVMINLGNNNVFVAPSNNVATDHGIVLGSNGGVITLKWNEDFELVNRDWYGIAVTGASDFYIIEVLAQ